MDICELILGSFAPECQAALYRALCDKFAPAHALRGTLFVLSGTYIAIFAGVGQDYKTSTVLSTVSKSLSRYLQTLSPDSAPLACEPQNLHAQTRMSRRKKNTWASAG